MTFDMQLYMSFTRKVTVTSISLTLTCYTPSGSTSSPVFIGFGEHVQSENRIGNRREQATNRDARLTKITLQGVTSSRNVRQSTKKPFEDNERATAFRFQYGIPTSK